MFEQPSDPILVVRNDRIIDCNIEAATFLGCLHKDSLLNMRPSDISPLMQPDGIRSDEKVKIVVESAQKNGFHRFEWLHLRADGSEVLVDIMLTLMKLNSEEVLEVIWRDLNLRN